MLQDDLCYVLLPPVKHHDHYQLLGGALLPEGVELFLASWKEGLLWDILFSSGLKRPS